MSTANWEEIKRLAADFQRAQLSISTQKLSERNCVEIVRTLQQLNLIELIYTQDGKEYLTHQELGKEIREELIAVGGRVNLVDLQNALNIDLSLIETKVSEIVGQENDLTLVLGQLINRSYLDGIADEINDKLQINGKLTIAELTKEYDLPGDFMSQMIGQRLGVLVIGKVDPVDPRLYYTDSFLARHRAIVQGALSACTRPVPLSTIHSSFNLQRNLVSSIASDLIEKKIINGLITGGSNGQFIPSVFQEAQIKSVEDFFSQNQYLDFDAMKRLGISDPKSYVQKRFAGRPDQPFYTNNYALSSRFNDSVDAEIDDAISNKSWSDVSSVLPSVLSDSDVAGILADRLKHHRSIQGSSCSRSAVLLAQVYVAWSGLTTRCAATFNRSIETKAEKDSKMKPVANEKQTMKDISSIEGGSMSKEERKEQRKKKQPSGAALPKGMHSREIKIKSSKKKGRGNKNDDFESNTVEENDKETFMNNQDIVNHLQNLTTEDMPTEQEKVDSDSNNTLMEQLSECPEELLVCIAKEISQALTYKYTTTLEELQKRPMKSKADERKMHLDTIKQIGQLWKQGILFEKAVNLLGEDKETILVRHLLRSICTDITNIIFVELAGDYIIYSDTDLYQITTEMRRKCLSCIPDQALRSVLMKLHTCCNGKSLSEFWSAMEIPCSQEYLSIVLMKNDKKKDQQLMLAYREETKEKLSNESDMASCLHLSVILLILYHFNMVLHAPGKCVPYMIEILKGKISSDDYGDLLEGQNLVCLQMQNPNEDVSDKVESLLNRVKAFSLSPKKK